MVMKKIVLSVAAVLAMSSFAVGGGDIAPVVVPVQVVPEEDNSNFYLGLGMVYNRTYSGNSGWFNNAPATQDETGGFTGVAGYNFNEYVAVEGRISKTFFEEDYADVTTYSLFLKPQYPITEDFTVYGLLGFGNVTVQGAMGDEPGDPANNGKDILNETTFQWGIGASYDVTESLSVFVDYTLLANDEDINSKLYGYDNNTYTELSVDGITVGVIYHF